MSEDFSQIEYQLIHEHLVNFFRKVEWDTQFKLNIEKGDTEGHLIEAYIDLKEWVVNITYPLGFLKKFIDINLINNLIQIYEPTTQIQKLNMNLPDESKIESEKLIYKGILYDFLAGVSRHEYGHSNECPIDNERFSIIVQATSTALKQEDKFNEVVLGYIMNLFCDLIINIIYGLEKNNRYYRNSIFLFHLSEIKQEMRPVNMDYAFFVLINLRIFQFHSPIRTTIEDLIIDYLPDNFEMIIKKFIQIFCPFEDILDKLLVGQNLAENQSWKLINNVSNTSNWGKMAFEFAKLMSKFISPNIMHEQLPVTDNSFVKDFFEDEMYKGEILSRIVNRKLEANENLQKSLPGQKPVFDPDQQLSGKMEEALEIEMDESYPGEMGFDYGLEVFSPVEIFDDLYEQRVKKVSIEIDKEESKSHLPITWMGRKKIDEQESFQQLDPMNVYFLPNSDELLVYKKIIPYTIPHSGIKKDSQFPDLAFFCDNSSSMQWDPISGTGYYDALIISIYSILEWLKTKNFASVIKYDLISFSSTTRETGWLDYFNIDDLKTQLFDYEGGGTYLDPRIFKEVVNNPRKKAILLITDGEIVNADELLKIILDNRSNMIFLFIQIGELSKLAKNLKKKGINMFQITDISKLSKIMLNFVKIAYGY